MELNSTQSVLTDRTVTDRQVLISMHVCIAIPTNVRSYHFVPCRMISKTHRHCCCFSKITELQGKVS